MSKELFISSSPHETKVAVLEDDQLVEVYYERATDVGLVGGIYKGRVSRVLPGMQSAFVDIGLERDAFLYVSDFFEDTDEYEKVFEEAEARAMRAVEGFSVSGPPVAQGQTPVSEVGAGKLPSGPAPETVGVATEQPRPASAGTAQTKTPVPPAPVGGAVPSAVRAAGEGYDYRRNEQRGRRRRRRGHGFREEKFPPKPEFRPRPPEPQGYGPPHAFELLPGESLAKYRRKAEETPSGAPPLASSTEPGAEESVPAQPASGEFQAPPAKAVAEPTFEQATSGLSLPLSEPEPLAEGFAASTPQMEASPLPLPEHPVTEASVEASATAQPDMAVATPVEAAEGPPTVPAIPAWSPVAETLPEDSASPVLEPGQAAAGEPPVGLIPAAEESVAVSAVPSSLLTEGNTAPAPLPLAQDEAAPAEPCPAPVAPSETPSRAPDRTYTLREPHQRPRFAPRRGRRGPPGPGPRAPRPERRPEPSRPGNDQPVQIAELLKEGQEILVQIAKEPLGRKGARITSHIALPGRYLVCMPTIDHIGVSRKITSEEERLRLRNTILENKGSLTGGFIVRTAGEGRAEEEFTADLKFLSTLWNGIRAKAEQTKAPALIHRDLDLLQRILRDALSPDFKSVRVDNEIEYARALDFVSRCQPALVGSVKLYTRDTPMFEEFGIQAEIEKALKPKVWLKSGGYIVINQTEALVAIDVNTGKYVGKTNRLEDTIVKTNIEAVNEIVRQLRLRDLGGIIVIDFIDMDERKNRNKVVQALEEALRHDRAPTKIVTYNEFGLVALTRKRVKQSLERTLCEPCYYCTGSGWIKSVTSVCYEILAEARKMARQVEGNSLTLRVHPDVAQALKSREGTLLSELESLTHKDVIIKSDPTVHQERFEIF